MLPDMMVAAVRISRRNRWPKQERIDWERELEETLDDDDWWPQADGPAEERELPQAQ